MFCIVIFLQKCRAVVRLVEVVNRRVALTPLEVLEQNDGTFYVTSSYTCSKISLWKMFSDIKVINPLSNNI